MHLYNDRTTLVRPLAACSKMALFKRLGCDGEVQLGCLYVYVFLGGARPARNRCPLVQQWQDST